MKKTAARIIDLCKDRRGVAAIEFAFIAPILLILYFLTMEASQAIETSKKISRIGSMVADLAAQEPQVSTDSLDAIMKIANTTLQPYNRSKPTIVVTGINITNEATPRVEVAWSRKVVNGTYSSDTKSGDPTTVPEALRIGGSFLVRVTSTLGYRPVIAWTADPEKTTGIVSAFDNITMSETYYLRPRLGQSISCSNC